jgi:hypothetical protein
MIPISRRFHLSLLAANALRLPRCARADEPTPKSEGGRAPDPESPPSIQSDHPNDFVQVQDGKFMLRGRRFIIKGTNYFGSWRHRKPTIAQSDGVEQANIWSLLCDWDTQATNADFQFIARQLAATTIRTGTPTLPDFANLVQYHHYAPWYNTNGTISEQYKANLVKLADTAFANNLRVQLCLLWGLGHAISQDANAFKPGETLDKFYSNQVRSIAMALRNHPGVISFSMGNELLVDQRTNGAQRSWYEARAGGFILRRLNDLRAASPLQLLTIDEIAAPGRKTWYDPGPEFALLPDDDNSNGGKPFRLADNVDYLAPHFYPETLTTADLGDAFTQKIEDAKEKLRSYMRTADAIGKPVAIGEFGLKVMPPTLSPAQYSAARDRFFVQFLDEAQKTGLQGLLVWAAIPEIALTPGHYWVKASKLNPYSPIEVDIDAQNHTQRRVLFYRPEFNLFEWRNGAVFPARTLAAKAISSAWVGIPRPKTSGTRIGTRWTQPSVLARPTK